MRGTWILAAAVATVASAATAGTFKTITIDGDFADWSGVPDATVDPTGDGNPIDFGSIQIANDADYLYVRISYVTPVNPNIGPSVFFAFDTDNNVATGYNIYGLNTVGSEAGFQNDFPFDQRTGFNVGSLSAPGSMLPVDWGNPAAEIASQEYVFPRNLTFSSDSAPVFANPSFTLMLWTDSSVAIDTTSGLAYTFATPVAGWKNDVSGDWLDNANWTYAAAPNGVDALAEFRGAITTAQTVFANAAVTAGTLQFDNLNQYVIGGTGSLTLDVSTGNVTVGVAKGSHKINLATTIADNADLIIDSGATLTFADPVNLAAGKTLNKLSGGTLEVLAAVSTGAGSKVQVWDGVANIRAGLGASAVFQSDGGTTNLFASQTVADVVVNAGEIKIDSAGAAKVLKTSSLTVGVAKLDLGDNGMIVQYSGANPLADITADVVSAYASGLWTGNGITSSLADASHAIGIATSADISSPFMGVAFTGNAVLVRYALKGDADLNGSVNFNDLLALAKNYNGTDKRWVHGDADYNGQINFNDLLALAKNYNGSLLEDGAGLGTSGDFAADLALAQSLVPEPTAVLGLCGGLLALRRRRH